LTGSGEATCQATRGPWGEPEGLETFMENSIKKLRTIKSRNFKNGKGQKKAHQKMCVGAKKSGDTHGFCGGAVAP